MMVNISSEDSSSDSRSKTTKTQTIFSCAEIEARSRNRETKGPKQIVPNLKLNDKAIMYFSSKNGVTRYTKSELEALKESKLSKTPPHCFFNQKIQQLKILIEQSPGDQEAQLRAFQEMLPNMSVNKWDPKIVDLLNQYHRSLLAPQYDYMNNSYNNPKSPRKTNQRRVSWGDQKEFINNQQKQTTSYDQKNFFDTITTTTTLRPPRMGVGSLGSQKNFRQQTQVRSAKGNPCASERHAFYPSNLSAGSVSFSESKSSYDESMDKSSNDKNESSSNFLSDKKEDDEVSESEAPEWFTWPASRADVIDLHGFEDDENQMPNTSESDNGNLQKGNPSKPENQGSYHYRRSNYNQYGSRPQGNNSQPSNYYNNPRYRNPLHNSRASASSHSSFNRSDQQNMNYIPNGMEGMPINPFFEMFKRENIHQQNINLMNWMNPNPSMRTISDIEAALRNSKGQFQTQQQFNPTLQQLFQLASTSGFPQQPVSAQRPYGFDNFQPGAVPTPEQLQQHTSEIMRNAIMRKHFGKDRKFPK